MKFTPRAVPWSCPEEWDYVRQLLYSSDSNKKHLGVNKVKCWAARGRVPHAAEITSMLVELTIQHKQYSPREYSYLLSMTLIRFVNGIVDSGQKGSVACSAIKIAEQANLPAWIVELRHSATHDQIPCLQMLINAQQQALEWLQQNYWEVQGGVAKSTVDLLRNCLYEYVLLRSSNSAIMDERQDGNLLKALRKIAGKLNDDDYAQVLFPLLSSICVDFDPNVELFQLWLPLIQYFDRKWPNFASKFVIGIVEFQNADFTENQVIGARNLELAKALTDYVANRWSTSELDEAILQCLESKNQELLDLAQLILQRGQPSPKVTSLLMFNIKRSKIEKQYIENTRKANINPSTVSANEMFVLNEMLEKQMGSVVLQSYCNTSIHTVALDSANDHWTLVGNWAQSPIGCLPGETSIPDLDLDSCYDDMNWLAENNLLRYPGDISMQIDSDDGFSNDNRTASFPIQLF